MRIMRVLAACAVLSVTASVAQANIILINGTPAASFTDLGAQGFGNAPRMLTLQDSPQEIGGVIPVDTETGQAIDGANKSTTPTLSTLSWDSGAEVGIGFNSNQVGNGDIILNNLVLTVWAADGITVKGTFSLAAPVYFSEADLALQQGNGNSVFNFGLDAVQQAQFAARKRGGSPKVDLRTRFSALVLRLCPDWNASSPPRIPGAKSWLVKLELESLRRRACPDLKS